MNLASSSCEAARSLSLSLSLSVNVCVCLCVCVCVCVSLSPPNGTGLGPVTWLCWSSTARLRRDTEPLRAPPIAFSAAVTWGERSSGHFGEQLVRIMLPS